jgi:hypothetical protein
MRKMPARFSIRSESSRRVSAAFFLLLFLALQLFASSESLHKWIHPDADSADHHCAITLISHGQVNASEAALPLAAFVAALFFILPRLQSAISSSFDYRFSASRAPPLV